MREYGPHSPETRARISAGVKRAIAEGHVRKSYPRTRVRHLLNWSEETSYDRLRRKGKSHDDALRKIGRDDLVAP